MELPTTRTKGTIIGLVSIIIITPIVLSLYSFGMKSIFLPLNKNLERKVFETSVSYVKGASQDLAKYRYEYNSSNDEVERKAIRELVLNRFSDLDTSQLKNEQLKEFLRRMR